MEFTKEDEAEWEWVEGYRGDLCVECGHSRPVSPGSGLECVADHPLDCPALPEEKFYTQ